MNQTPAITANPARLLLTGLLGTLALLAALPALSHAGKVNFGADLKAGPINPVAAPMPCSDKPGKGCTRIAMGYGNPPHAGFTPYAPKKGVIKKIKLIADNPGKLRVQVGQTQGVVGGTGGQITRTGPRINYQGTGSIEKFKVHIPVKKFDYLAFKTRYANTLSCGAGFDTEAQFQPTLKVGGPTKTASAVSDCTHLIGARMKY